MIFILSSLVEFILLNLVQSQWEPKRPSTMMTFPFCVWAPCPDAVRCLQCPHLMGSSCHLWSRHVHYEGSDLVCVSMIVVEPECWNVFRCTCGLLHRRCRVFLCTTVLTWVSNIPKGGDWYFVFLPQKTCTCPIGSIPPFSLKALVVSLVLGIYYDSFSIPVQLTSS